MSQSQQEFLTEAMEYLGLTKTALAIKLNTSVSTVNAWLLAEGRTGFAFVPEFIEEKISNLVDEKKSANFFQIHSGSSAEDFPGKYCDKYQFRFPTLYRVTVHNADGAEVSYTLSDSINNDPTDINSLCVPIPHLDAARDSAWVFINEHSSMNAVLGYWRAISNSNPVSVGSRFKLYLFEDHLFSIYYMDMPGNALIDNLVSYQIDDNEFQIAMPTLRRKPFDDWGLIVDSDGNEKNKDEIWK